ncbi:hypothetical protein L6452_03528 [Arctium lappa]|uniref:Uncharacterized protein n=1 Tax=Arctium lappa TaxID=4217 RepID=A0ACB9FLW7_ARCLA|nr:hypothetical protein L6452_03528 [Arctium lappa]
MKGVDQSLIGCEGFMCLEMGKVSWKNYSLLVVVALLYSFAIPTEVYGGFNLEDSSFFKGAQSGVKSRFNLNLARFHFGICCSVSVGDEC